MQASARLIGDLRNSVGKLNAAITASGDCGPWVKQLMTISEKNKQLNE